MSLKNFFTIIILFVFINQIQGSFWSDPLTTVKNKIESSINSAIDEINNNLNTADNQINNISEQLIKTSEEFSQSVYDDIINKLNKMNDDLNNLTNSGDDSKNGSYIDLSECKKISETMDTSALIAYSNMSSCVVEKLELCAGYSESIKKIGNDVLTNLTTVKDDFNYCFDNSSTVKSQLKTIGCADNVGVKATWITINSLPNIAINITKLMSKMTALQITLPYCVVSHGINDLSNKYNDIYNRTKNCVDEKKNKKNINYL